MFASCPLAPTLREEVFSCASADAFRAGYLAGVAWGLPADRSCQIGSLLATYVIETVGTQEYELARQRFLGRIAQAYGDVAAADIEPHLVCARP